MKILFFVFVSILCIDVFASLETCMTRLDEKKNISINEIIPLRNAVYENRPNIFNIQWNKFYHLIKVENDCLKLEKWIDKFNSKKEKLLSLKNKKESCDLYITAFNNLTEDQILNTSYLSIEQKLLIFSRVMKCK